MRRLGSSIATLLVMFAMLPLQARAAEYLIPVGKIVGLQLQDDTVTVAAYDDILGARAREAGLKIGDEIIKIDGSVIHCAQDVKEAVKDGREVSVTVRRGSRTTILNLTPHETQEGAKLGVYLRQGIAGIGTVTFYDPETGRFGTLGHGVSSPKGGLLKMTRGSAYEAQLLSIRKGRAGEPGQLKGSAREDTDFAELVKNTPQGVFGITTQGWTGQPIPTASYEEVHTGPASIRCTVDSGNTQEYSVEIMKIYPQTKTDCRNFLLKVTDPALLELTGGIVQGMGVIDNRDNTEKPGNTGFFAVTLSNDPTTGV